MYSFEKFMCAVHGYAGGESISHNAISRPFPARNISISPTFTRECGFTAKALQHTGHHYSRSIINCEITTSGPHTCKIKYMCESIGANISEAVLILVEPILANVEQSGYDSREAFGVPKGCCCELL